jgi:hypothetical protein
MITIFEMITNKRVWGTPYGCSPLYPPPVSTLLCYPPPHTPNIGAQFLTIIFPKKNEYLKRGLYKKGFLKRKLLLKNFSFRK